MWRVILSVVVIVIDAFWTLLFLIVGLVSSAHETGRVSFHMGISTVPSGGASTSALVGSLIIAGTFAINILAILFGARLRFNRERPAEAAKAFE